MGGGELELALVVLFSDAIDVCPYFFVAFLFSSSSSHGSRRKLGIDCRRRAMPDPLRHQRMIAAQQHQEGGDDSMRFDGGVPPMFRRDHVV